jgi:DNA helicase HerA-like ATPase
MKQFLETAAMQHNPLRVLQDFVRKEDQKEQAKEYDTWRFVGYVLEIGYDTTTIITSDPFKKAVGGIPRNSLLVMIPSNYTEFPPHFTLLRVLETAPTPLTRDVQQTYFELQKKSMPELDVFTQSELQWGALKTSMLGMYYPHPDDPEKIEFSGDLNNFVSAHKYRIYAPDDDLLDLITNALVPKENRFALGKLRLTECRLPLPDSSLPNVDVNVSTKDFMGTRTAMFGKTRLGKSNVVKIIAQSLIETTKDTKKVGQIIFDINGEYANDNPQDDSTSLASVYPKNCEVYAFKPKNETSKILKLNFYEHPDRSHKILTDLLESEKRNSIYVRNFIGAEIPSIESIDELDIGDQKRTKRRILIYWAILKSAGFDADESELKKKISLDPGYNKEFREVLYGDETPPKKIDSLKELVSEYRKIADFIRDRKDDDPVLISKSSKKSLFDQGDRALLNFLSPGVGAGPAMLHPFHTYHDKDAGNIFGQIITSTNDGQTVILDLGNADPQIMVYYTEQLCLEVFKSQMEKFTSNTLGDKFIQLYFEEAHNLFPKDEDVTTIYSRLSKEGAKYHIGMVYSTQSPSTINKDLLAQTENFFVAHISSRNEVKILANLNVAYENLQEDILQAKTPGYLRMLTRSHRFVMPVQARKFSPLAPLSSGGT